MSNLSNLYRLRTQLEINIQAKLIELEFAVLTLANAPQKFQQVTPRTELKAKIGAVTGHKNICPDGLTRFDTYRVSVALQVVCPLIADGKNTILEEYVATLRGAMSTLAQYSFADTTNFPDVFLAVPFKDAGTQEPAQKDGFQYAVLSYDSIVKIRETAWPAATN